MEEHVQAVAAVSDVVELGDQVQAAGLAVRGNRGALGIQLSGAVGVGVEDGAWTVRYVVLFSSLSTLCWRRKSSVLMSGMHFDAELLSVADFCRSSQVRSAVVCALVVSA